MWLPSLLFFFFNDTATTEIYTLSLHDALPIYSSLGPRSAGCGHVPVQGQAQGEGWRQCPAQGQAHVGRRDQGDRDRKSTRLNSSHANISYAVFCLKKKHET